MLYSHFIPHSQLLMYDKKALLFPATFQNFPNGYIYHQQAHTRETFTEIYYRHRSEIQFWYKMLLPSHSQQLFRHADIGIQFIVVYSYQLDLVIMTNSLTMPLNITIWQEWDKQCQMLIISILEYPFPHTWDALCVIS